MAPILIVEDRPRLRAMLRRALEEHGFAVEEAADGTAALRALGARRFAAVLTDLKLPGADGHAVLRAARAADPDLPVILMTAYGSIQDAVSAMKEGAEDFLPKPVDPDHLLLVLERVLERRALREENVLLKETFADRLGFPKILGASEALEAVTRQLQKVAPTDANVLLLGESGTGKELFARALHHLSPRRSGPFIAVNCAAIPEALLESELFGHERGAFTGADRTRAGKFEVAEGGTLFLDEIGEMAPALQAKLLRVLQDRAFHRVGGTLPLAADVRVVAATNRDPEVAVASGRVRQDLYYRLAVVSLVIPPLRERRGDILLLARHFLDTYSREMGRGEMRFTPSAEAALERHRWPGNVRELQNCIERAVILSEGPEVDAGHLGLESGDDGAAAERRIQEALAPLLELDAGLDETSRQARRAAEGALIRRALDEAGGNKQRAAQRLGIPYKRLLLRLRELDIERPSR